MTFPTEQAHHTPRPRPTLLRHFDGRPALRLLEAAGDRELRDTRITVEDRQLVRRLVALFEPLMHFVCGIEAAAWRKRAAEEASRT